MEIFTIGHSTHTKEEFIKFLNGAQIETLVDVRSFPGRCKYPHFHIDQMKEWLPKENINYTHMKELGGRRNKNKDIDDEVNNAWNNQSFHNYADYTLEEDFQTGIEKLKECASQKRVAYCCAERHPSRCHRLLISNWLSLNGWTVRHILDGPHDETEIVEHKPGQWGASPTLNHQNQIIYPK